MQPPSLLSKKQHLPSYPPVNHMPNSVHVRCLDVGRGLLLWQRSESEVWLDDAEFGEEGLGLVVLDTWVHDHVISWNPVDRGGDAVLVPGL